MTHYEYINKPYINPINLEVLGKTLNTLEQGHQQTIAQAATLKTELAKLPLNPEEEDFRQGLYNEIEATIQNNSNGGNAYYALDDVVKLSGDLLSSRALSSRVEAQTDYKNWLDNLEKDTTVDKDTKDYLKEKNTYKSGRSENDNGIVTWNPKQSYTSTPDVTAAQLKALQMVAKDAGASEVIYYKNANGEYTLDINQSVDNLPYYKIGTKFEKVSKDKLREAFDSILKNSPNLYQGLQQDYKVAKWKHEKYNQGGVDLTTNDAGEDLDFNEYIEKRITGFVNAATYNHITTTHDEMSGVTTYAAMLRNSAKNDGKGLTTGYTTQGISYIPPRSAVSTVIAGKNLALSNLKKIANSNQIEFDVENIEGSYNKLIQYYKDNNKVLPKAVYDNYQNYKTYLELYNSLVPKDDIETKDKIDFCTALEQGFDLSVLRDGAELNSYVKRHSFLINAIYNDSTTASFGINTDIIKKESDLKLYLSNYKDLGVTYNDKYITVDKDNAHNLFIIGNALYNVLAAKEIPIPNLSDFLNNKTLDSKHLKQIVDLYNETSEAVNKYVDENQVVIPSTVKSASDILETLSMERGDKENITKEIRDNITSTWGNMGAENIQMAIGIDNTPPNYNNNGLQRVATQKFINTMLAKFPSYVKISYDTQTLEQQIVVSIPEQTNENENDDFIEKFAKKFGMGKIKDRVVIRWDGANDPLKDYIKSGSEFKYNNRLANLNNSGIKEFTISNDTKLLLDNGYFAINKNGSTMPISQIQARDLLEAKDIFNDLNYYQEFADIYKLSKGDQSNIIQNFIIACYKANPQIDINQLATEVYTKSKFFKGFISDTIENAKNDDLVSAIKTVISNYNKDRNE